MEQWPRAWGRESITERSRGKERGGVRERGGDVVLLYYTCCLRAPVVEGEPYSMGERERDR